MLELCYLEGPCWQIKPVHAAASHSQILGLTVCMALQMPPQDLRGEILKSESAQYFFLQATLRCLALVAPNLDLNCPRDAMDAFLGTMDMTLVFSMGQVVFPPFF